MDNTTDIPGAAQTSTRLNAGATLRAAREAQGLTVADIAERIKFSVRQVEALESDDQTHLPQGTFLRGFIRSYARVLQLDESTVLETLPSQSEQHLISADEHSNSEAFQTVVSTRNYSRYLFVGAFIFALVSALFVWSHRDSPKLERAVVEEVKLPESAVVAAPVSAVAVPDVLAASAVQIPTALVKVAEPVAQPASKDKPKVAEQKTKEVETKAKVVESKPGVVAAKPNVVESKAKVAEPKPAVVEPKTKPVEAKAVKPPVVAAPIAVPAATGKPDPALARLQKRPIHIVFLEEAWVQIIDTHGEVLLARTNPAGSEKWIGGGPRAPYQVSVSKTKSVRIFYNGREVDLSRYNQSGLVHLELK